MPSPGQLAAAVRSLGMPSSGQLATAEKKEAEKEPLFEALFADIDNLMADLSERKTVLKTEKTQVNRHLAYLACERTRLISLRNVQTAGGVPHKQGWVKEITPTGLETIKKHLKRKRDVSTQVAANCLHPELVREAS